MVTIINENATPLPRHTKIDYDECRAKLTLEELFPEKYTQLLLSDKPDLWGNGVGIEVTIADDRKRQEAYSNWIKATKTENEKVRDRAIERMHQLGVEYTGGIQGWPMFDNSFHLIAAAVITKMDKLATGNYSAFPRYELFLFTDIWLSPKKITEADEFFFSERVKYSYQTVYVFSQGRELHIFDTENNTYHLLRIDMSEQSSRNRRAWQMVEEGEQA
jgi:hypothetical protein